MREVLNEDGLDLLFREARTCSAWQDKQVSDDTLKALYELLKMGPTSVNASPARIAFLRTPEAKERLKPALDPANVKKTMLAPVTAIVGYDLAFYDQLPKLFPHADARAWFSGNAPYAEATAFRNSSLQGGYLIMVARSLGLDCGPMSGFDNAKVDQEFFGGTTVRSNFLCNIGYGDRGKLFPRCPRLDFGEACQLL